jgi:hypothetical protein
MRAWTAGRIKERRPLAGLVALGLGLLAWLGLHYGIRAWEIPNVGEPIDRVAFRRSLPAPHDNVAARKLSEAVTLLESGDDKANLWLEKVAEASRLPVGVLEVPSNDGQTPSLRQLPAFRKMAALLDERSRKAQARGEHEAAFEHLAQVLALSRTLRHKAGTAWYLEGIEVEREGLLGLDRWLVQAKPAPALLRKVQTELGRHLAETPSPLDCLQTECFRAGGVLATPTAWSFYSGQSVVRERWLAGIIAFSLDTPWEDARKTRLWRAVWAGQLEAVKTPHWQVPESREPLDAFRRTTKVILRDWLPPANEPTLTATRLAHLLDASWLSDDRLFTPAGSLRAAGNRARWRIEAARLTVALALYRLSEGKAAQKLEDLVPEYLAELPVDPYSGKGFRYRISRGEVLDVPRQVEFQGRAGPARWTVREGQGIVWSTGPDQGDHGGTRHGGALRDDDSQWPRDGFDLLSIVPTWP